MEQDIKDIELFIDFCRAPYNFEHESEEKSYKELSDEIEHLIKAYKELEEENKIIKGNYYTLCGDIQMVTSELGFPEDTIITDEMVSMIKENYIPVSLVEEKIDDFRNKTVWGYNDWKYDENVYKAELNIIDKLEKELLEKRK